MRSRILVAAVFVLLFSACMVGSPQISIEGAYALKEQGEEGYAYALFMGIINSGKADDYLVGAKILNHPEARVELHKTEAGKMVPVDRIKVPAGKLVRLAPGEKHIMVFGLPGNLERLEVELEFEKSGSMRVSAEVREYKQE